MSDAQDGKSAKRRRESALASSPGADGLWDYDALRNLQDYADGPPVGARFRAPTSATELASLGFAGGGAGPDPMIGLQQWLDQKGMTLQDFQKQYGGLPLTFNDDGTATYDPSAQRQSFSYNNPDDGTFHKVMPYVFSALAGAGLTGMLPGTESVFGSAAGASGAAGGAMDMGVGLGGELGAWGGITPLEVASSLGVDASTGAKVLETAKTVMSKPGATSQMLSSAIKSVTGLDVSPSMVSTIGKIGVAAAAALGGGGSGSGGGGVSSTAASQSAAANDAMGLAREQWAWNKARAEEIWPQTKALVDQQLKTSQLSADRAKSEWDTYQSLYLPAEKQYVDKMTTWDTPDRRTQRIQESVADVNRGYDAAGGTLERGLARSGVRPGGDGFVQAMSDLSRARAADTAGATNNARRQVENEGIAGLERVTNIGRNRPSTSFAADQLALAAGNSGNANANQSTATTNAGLSAGQGWFNTGVNALNSAGSLQNTAYKNESDNSAGIGKLLGQLFEGFSDGGLVRRRGMGGGYADGGLVRKAERKLQKHLRPMMNMRMAGYADGGLVRGPGTETSDSIPAMIDGQEPTALSTGEAVLNAEAVQIVGPEFVERVNQAGLERRGRPGRVIEGEARRVM